MVENPLQTSGLKLNFDVHPSLLQDRDLTFLLNGDIEDQSGNSWFVTNQLGNEICFEFPEGYELKGSIKLNNFEHILFFKTSDSYEIGNLYTLECSYVAWVNDPCLNLEWNVRGVYKFNNKENDRRIYFIDGNNPNRFADIDKPFPKDYTGSKCDSCAIEEGETLNCEALRINKNYQKPCIEVNKGSEGKLLSGSYQVGVAYAIDNVILTDFTFSPSIKVFSESANNSLEVDISCIDSLFDQYAIILVSNTRENSLVTYNYGFFPVSNTKFVIESTDNATVFSTQQALQKRVMFDTSNHITTNGEVLLLGGHQAVDNLNYQPLANTIDAEWNEIKIPKELAPYYPSLLRDEVYSFGVEWFDKRGNSKGVFHIPGRQSVSGDVVEYTGDEYATNDIYEVEDCLPATLKKWQIENTATLTNDYGVTCSDCSGVVVSKAGLMGYWESENYTYPNDSEVWGNLACEPVRHHRMPSHDLTHIHNSSETITTDPGDCYEICYTIAIQGEFETTYEEVCETYCPSGETTVVESDCVNILGVRFKNIPYPKLADSTYDPDISGYRILVGDRKGNKSILHKGLIYNMAVDSSIEDTEILYPNYPFNDLHPDVFLSTVQTLNNATGSLGSDAGWIPPSTFTKNHFTYHSPDIHFREIEREFGTELKVYGESYGGVEGIFDKMFLHPKTRLGIGDIQLLPYRHNVRQVNSLCNYTGFTPWTTDFLSRFKIETSQYLLPINQLTSNNKKVNNHYRETSYYVNLGRDLQNPTTKDTSRITQREKGSSYKYPQVVSRYDSDVSGMVDSQIQGSAYYTGIKVKQPNQYGSIDSIAYRPVSCVFQVRFPGEFVADTFDSAVIYAGDIFISKHSILRKMPLFTEWLEDVPFDVETNYRENRNVWYPRFWYDNESAANDQYNLDGFIDNLGGGDYLAGMAYMYVFVTGVAYFWCESEFIGDYRERDFTPNGNYYPKADYREIATTDKIRYDNKFLYNFSLLKDEIERVYSNSDRPVSDNDFMVSYSLKDDLQSAGDRWLQFLPLNYTILPRIYGNFTGMHYTDDYSVFFLFENQILYSQMNYSLQTSEGSSLLLTQGDIFTNRLRKLSNETTGFVGCVDPLSFVNTRFGAFFFDRYRKKFFQWNGQLKDVTGNMQSWLQHFTTDVSSNYDDACAVSVFDNFTGNIYLRGSSQRENWCLSYKPKLESWVSFHSFTPRYFLSEANTYLSADASGIWRHNSEFNYQTYYGQQVPFDVGLVVNNQYKNSELQNVELYTEFLTQQVYGSPIYKVDKFFDKIFAYNNNGSTGLLPVFLKNLNNPNHSLNQNTELNPIQIEVSRVQDSVFRFNKFENLRVDHTNQPLLTLSDNGMDYTPESLSQSIPPHQREDIKGKWVKLHLRSETNTDHKILLQLLVPNIDQTLI